MLIMPATEATAREMDENRPWLMAPNSNSERSEAWGVSARV